MNKISIKKLLLLKNINIIDIRSSKDYNEFHIKNSINIEFSDLYFNFKTILSQNQIYYIICNSGYKSKRIVKLLNKNNYKSINVKGGYRKLNHFNF